MAKYPHLYSSLTATILRCRITGALRSLKISESVSAIRIHYLYAYPSIDLLTGFLVNVVAHPNGTRVEGGINYPSLYIDLR